MESLLKGRIFIRSAFMLYLKGGGGKEGRPRWDEMKGEKRTTSIQMSLVERYLNHLLGRRIRDNNLLKANTFYDSHLNKRSYYSPLRFSYQDKTVERPVTSVIWPIGHSREVLDTKISNDFSFQIWYLLIN